MKSAVYGTLSFALAAFAPAFVLSVAALWSPPVAEARPDRNGDLLMVLIYYGYTNGFRTLGFAIPTALSAAWRHSPTKRVVMIAVALGLTSPITSTLVLAAMVKWLLPMFRWAPWLAIVLSNGVPGLLLGLIAIFIAGAYLRPTS